MFEAVSSTVGSPSFFQVCRWPVCINEKAGFCHHSLLCVSGALATVQVSGCGCHAIPTPPTCEELIPAQFVSARFELLLFCRARAFTHAFWKQLISGLYISAFCISDGLAKFIPDYQSGLCCFWSTLVYSKVINCMVSGIQLSRFESQIQHLFASVILLPVWGQLPHFSLPQYPHC